MLHAAAPLCSWNGLPQVLLSDLDLAAARQPLVEGLVPCTSMCKERCSSLARDQFNKLYRKGREGNFTAEAWAWIQDPAKSHDKRAGSGRLQLTQQENN